MSDDTELPATLRMVRYHLENADSFARSTAGGYPGDAGRTYEYTQRALAALEACEREVARLQDAAALLGRFLAPRADDDFDPIG